MKGTGALGPIVEVPSETGDSQTYRSDFSDQDDQRSKRHDSHSADEGRSPFQSEDEDIEEDLYEEPDTNRSKSGRSNKVKKNRRDVDMTPPEELLEQYEMDAKHYADKKQDTKAIQEYIKCTALARIVFGDNHWRLAKAYADLANAYFDLKGYAPQAESHAEFAKNIIKNVQMSSDKAAILDVILTIYYTLGRACASQKKYEPASDALTKAKEVNRQRAQLKNVRTKETDNWNMKIYLALAKLKARQKAWGQAEDYYKRALEIMEKTKSLKSTDLIPLYQGLGRVEQSKGGIANHEEAIRYFEQAHEIASKRDKDSVLVGDTAVSLAEAYANVGETDAELSAESYFRDAHGVYLTHYGPSHEKTIDVQDQLAHLQIRAERQDDAIDTLRDTIAPKKELYGELSAPVADTYKLIGNVHLAQQDMEKALRALKKCHNIEMSLYGTNNRKTKDTQRTLDILLANPNLASKHKKSSAEGLKERPRFNSIVKRESRQGGTRTDTY